ncbi:MAG: serine--tRNA ligase [Patescibacteria group bacterium]|jgi:seryl-tRNA synthetase
MIDIQLIREHLDLVKKGLTKKQSNPELAVDAFKLDKEKRRLQTEVEAFQSNLNQVSKEIAKEFGQKKVDLLKQANQISEQIDKHRPHLDALEKDLNEVMAQIPNMPLDDVIAGHSDKDNKVAYKKGDVPKFGFTVKDHIQLAADLDLIEFDAAAKSMGSRFAYLKNELVVLEFALMRYGLDQAMKSGFKPILPPILLNRAAMDAAGYLGQAEEEIYKTQDDLYLAGTAEQPLLALHAGQMLKKEDLPLRYVGFSSCFRREAGSYGKDVKGILRMHQFQKLELFSFVEPEMAEQEHKKILELEEKLMASLDIPYQVIDICAGDLGFPAAKKWDIEAWMAGQNTYRETHSCSNCTDFQARRMNIRYKDEKGTRFVYTLNGTVFSERPLIAILENNQQKDGSIKVPKVLAPYTGFDVIKK